jgi:hypothetical protein
MSKKFTYQELSNLYKQLADGASLEYRSDTRLPWVSTHKTPCMTDLVDDWQIKTVKNAIDMTSLVTLGMDCEFSDEPEFLSTNTRISTLRGVADGPSYYAHNSPNQYLYCRPRMNHLHAWSGSMCPLAGFMIHAYFSSIDYTTVFTSTCYIEWNSIVYVEFLKLEPTYAYGWDE